MVARRNLLAEKTRLLMSIGGVAFAVLLSLSSRVSIVAGARPATSATPARSPSSWGRRDRGRPRCSQWSSIQPRVGSRSTQSTSPGSTDASSLASGARPSATSSRASPPRDAHSSGEPRGRPQRRGSDDPRRPRTGGGAPRRRGAREQARLPDARPLGWGEAARIDRPRWQTARDSCSRTSRPPTSTRSTAASSCITCADSLKRRAAASSPSRTPPARGDRRQSAVPGGRANPGRGGASSRRPVGSPAARPGSEA